MTLSLSLARQAFVAHKSRSKRRGIEFKLTFEQWRDIWGDRLGECGVMAHQLGMCRIGDKGAYEVGNVYLGTPGRNAASRRMANENKAGKDHRNAHYVSRGTDQWNDNETDEEYIARVQGYNSRTVFA